MKKTDVMSLSCWRHFISLVNHSQHVIQMLRGITLKHAVSLFSTRERYYILQCLLMSLLLQLCEEKGILAHNTTVILTKNNDTAKIRSQLSAGFEHLNTL